MAINVKKSECMRFGQRHRNTCCEVVASGHSIKWVESAKYLGVSIYKSSYLAFLTGTRLVEASCQQAG